MKTSTELKRESTSTKSAKILASVNSGNITALSKWHSNKKGPLKEGSSIPLLVNAVSVIGVVPKVMRLRLPKEGTNGQ